MHNSYSTSLNEKKILVTGATGFIGKHLVAYLLDADCQIRLLIREKKTIQFDSDLKIEVSIGDLKDGESLMRACEGVDVIIHLAGLAHVNNVNNSLLKEINVNGTKMLISAAVKKKVSRFILISSSLASRQELKAHSDTSYGQTKFKAEQALLDAHLAGNIDGVMLRPVNVYGKGMKGNIGSLISLIKRGMMPPLPRLDTRISLVGVDDVSQAIVLAISSEKASGNIYSLTDGKEYLISDIEQEIYRAVGRKMPSWRTPRLLLYLGTNAIGFSMKVLNQLGIRVPIFSGISSRTYKNLISENVFDNSQACEELGFRPTTTFFSSLSDILLDDTG